MKLPNPELAYTNCVYVSQTVFAQLCSQPSEGPVYVEVRRVPGGPRTCVFNLAVHDAIADDALGLSDLQRRFAGIGMNMEVSVGPFMPPSASDLASCCLEVDFIKPTLAPERKVEVQDSDLEQLVHTSFSEHMLAIDQLLAIKVSDSLTLKLCIKSLQHLDLGKGSAGCSPLGGVLGKQTELDFQVATSASAKLQVLNNKTKQRSIFRPDFNFEELGIGGLSKEFGDIFRRAFAARVFPPRVLRALGTKHVRGMLLYGPPGTGKTLIARQLAKFLKAAEPKIINGPELLDKMVGETEKKVRMLFADAEKDQLDNGENSQLHVIVLDEIDSICKTRGSSRDSTGVSDNIVNQFLTKIDGVQALDNVLLIGMTNRKDMLDPALLRPGRLELHVEIGLPDEQGRAEILNIHTASMRKHGLLDNSVSVEALASRTRNFSGAELESLVRAAAASAMGEKVDVQNLSQEMDFDSLCLTKFDFDNALAEVKPLFGQDDDALEGCIERGILLHSSEFNHVLQKCENYLAHVRESESTCLLSSLLAGIPGSGKTALAVHLARRSDFPFIRRIASENLAGQSEQSKISSIGKVFEDAYRSPLSLVILDDVERLMDYACIGNRFSNSILQLIFGLLKKRPAKAGHRLLIIGTTSDPNFLRQVGLLRAFGTTLTVPALSSPGHFQAALPNQADLAEQLAIKVSGHSIGIRSLLEAAEMAAGQNGPAQVDEILEHLKDAGVLDA